MVYQVGRPAILEGKRFLPLTGTPIAKMLRNRILLADWDPEPWTVAIWMLKSLVIGLGGGADSEPVSPCADGAPALVVAMWRSSLRDQISKDLSLFLQLPLYRGQTGGSSQGMQRGIFRFSAVMGGSL